MSKPETRREIRFARRGKPYRMITYTRPDLPVDVVLLVAIYGRRPARWQRRVYYLN